MLLARLFVSLLILYGLNFVLFLTIFIVKKDSPKAGKICLIMIFAPLILAFLLWLFLFARGIYMKNPITQDRIVGTYQIDTHFYPGPDADWQREHFYFKITADDQFIFFEKLADGSYKTIEGKVDWYNFSPSRFRIAVEQSHPLIDEYPTLYRGNRKFYYVFDSEFGNMFYRKVK